jgi:hypothetical protein
MFPAAGEEHDSNHEAQQEKSKIREAGQLRKEHAGYSAGEIMQEFYFQ